MKSTFYSKSLKTMFLNEIDYTKYQTIETGSINSYSRSRKNLLWGFFKTLKLSADYYKRSKLPWVILGLKKNSKFPEFTEYSECVEK